MTFKRNPQGQQRTMQRVTFAVYGPEYENGLMPAELIHQTQQKSGGHAKVRPPAAISFKK